MRFYLNRAKNENTILRHAPLRSSNQNLDGFDSDFRGKRRNASYPYYDGEHENMEHLSKPKAEHAGNEKTPVKKLPKELLEYILERRMDDFRKTYYEDEHEFKGKPIPPVVGHPKIRWYMVEDEEKSRTLFLHDAGLVCRGWLSVAGRMNCRVVLVDGLPDDYKRAIEVLKIGFPGVLSDPKGSLVRELRIDFKREHVDGDLVKDAVKLLNLCTNVQKLIIRGSGLEVAELQVLWGDAISGLAGSLVSLESTVRIKTEYPIGTAPYLRCMALLTELDLEETDEFYDFNGWDRITLPVLQRYKLTTLHSSIMRYQAKWGLHSLNHFTVTIGRYSRIRRDDQLKYDAEAVQIFFEAHGYGLKYLEIRKHPSLYNPVQSLLDTVPALEQLAIDIDLLILKNHICIGQDSVRLLYITGFLRVSLEAPSSRRYTTAASHMAIFLKSLREDRTFPCLEVVILDTSHWQMRLNEEVVEEWLKWFDIEGICRPIIVDINDSILTLEKLAEFSGAVLERALRLHRNAM